MSLSDYQWRVNDLVRDKDQVISTAQRDQAVAEAVLRYSLDFPRIVTVDLVAVGGVYMSLPAGWQTGYSKAIAFEYPVNMNPISEIPLNEVTSRYFPSEEKFEFQQSFTAGETIRLRYTQRHAVDASLDTIREEHRYPVCCWAAAILCGELANWYATEGASTLGADTADHVGKTERLRARMRDLFASYNRDLGVSEKRPNIAGTVVELPRKDTEGRPTLFRNRRGA